jgi:hypothetical protein
MVSEFTLVEGKLLRHGTVKTHHQLSSLLLARLHAGRLWFLSWISSRVAARPSPSSDEEAPAFNVVHKTQLLRDLLCHGSTTGRAMQKLRNFTFPTEGRPVADH